MKSGVDMLVGLVCFAAGWSLVCVPLILFGLKRNRAAPERATRGALPFALGIGAWTGLTVGALGFMWGAGIPDESAGAIATMLFSIGCFGTGPLAAGIAWFAVARAAKRPRAPG